MSELAKAVEWMKATGLDMAVYRAQLDPEADRRLEDELECNKILFASAVQEFRIKSFGLSMAVHEFAATVKSLGDRIRAKLAEERE